MSDSESEGSGTGSKASVLTMSLPVHFPSKDLTCKLCKHNAREDSPLITSRQADTDNGFRPWAKYIKVMVEGSRCKVPTGRICGICHNVYRALGASCCGRAGRGNTSAGGGVCALFLRMALRVQGKAL